MVTAGMCNADIKFDCRVDHTNIFWKTKFNIYERDKWTVWEYSNMDEAIYLFIYDYLTKPKIVSFVNYNQKGS